MTRMYSPKKISHYLLYSLGIILNCYAPFAFAQVSSLPPSVLPERASQAIPASTPSTRPSWRGAPMPAAKPAFKGEAAKIRFKLNGITIVGAHVYTQAQLRPLYQDKLGKTITIAQLGDIVNSITNFYRNNGYILSRAILPPQNIANGKVRIQVIEGFVDHINITGNPGPARPLIEMYAQRIKESRPLQEYILEKYLLLINDIPGFKVKVTFVPSKFRTGAADLNFYVTVKKFGGFVSLDNYGTRYIGPLQLSVGLNVNSLLRLGDKTQLTFVTTDSNELKYIDLSHDTPLGYYGTRFILGGNFTITKPGFTLEPLLITGRSKLVYLNIVHPWIRSRAHSVTVRGGFNYLDSNLDLMNSRFYTDHVRTVFLGGLYESTDSWGGINTLDGAVTRGIGILGATDKNDEDVSRLGATSVFTKVNVRASRLQPLSERFSAFIHVLGQYAFDPLLISQQFGFGGNPLGRGYDPSEIIGDHGLAGSLELRMDTTRLFHFFQNAQLYGFYDIAKIWTRETSSSPNLHSSAASMGIGTRLLFTEYLSGNAYIAKPLTRPVSSEIDANHHGNRIRGFFSLTFTF